MKKIMMILLLVLTLTLNVFGVARNYNPDTLPKISIEAVKDDAIIIENNDEFLIVEQEEEVFLVVE